MLRDFAVPNEPQIGCARLAAVRLIAECADMFPLVSDCPHICCLHNQLSEVECVRQIKTKTNAVRLKTPLPLRMARVPTITLPSRGFGCTPKTPSCPRHHLRDLPPSQVRLPPVPRPCPPAKRTYCSRVLSLHTFAELWGATVAVVARSLHRKHLLIGPSAFPAPPFELALPLPPLPFPCAFPPLPP